VLPDTIVPEIQRSNLAGSILQLKSLGIENIMTFDWLAAPSAEAVIRGLETLHALGTLGDDARLTDPLGIQVSELPLDPVLGRILLAGGEMGCAAEVATIVAMLSVQSVWWLGGGEKRAQQHAKAKFAVSQGDLLTYLNVWKAWEDSGRDKKWAVKHFVNHRSMLRAADIRRQLGAHLHRLRISSSSGGGGNDMVDTIQKALTCGLFINAARLLSDDEVVHHYGSTSLSDDRYSGGVYHLIRRTPPPPSAAAIKTLERLCMHPSSVLYKCRPQWVCFYNAQQSDDGWYEMHDVVAIQSEWLTQLAPHMYTSTR
jgi:ATP-dependent RNA helicase DDX35